jgi:uncharacterized membrane protein
MDISGEIAALRAQQNRLRMEMDRLDARLDLLEKSRLAAADIPPAPPVTESVPPPLLEMPPVTELAKPASDEPLRAEEAVTSQAAPSVVPPPLPDLAVPPPISTPVAPPPLPPSARESTSPGTEEGGRESLELRLGRVWLVRVGIVILLTGLVFLGNYAYHELIGRLGPIGKLALLYLAGSGLCILGMRVGRKRESLRNYGRVLAAGGCAAIYYATYAAHFVPSLQVIASPVVGGALLLGLGGLFVGIADRIRSQTLAAATIALSFYTAAINPVSTFPLFSNVVIALAAIVLLARRDWRSVSLLSLLGSYGSFAFWRFQQGGTFLPSEPMAAAAFWASVLFPVAYWIVHTVAIFLRRVRAFPAGEGRAFLTLNNAALFALAGPMVEGTYPHAFWLAAVLFGTVLLGLAALSSRTEEPTFDGAYLAQGLGLVVLGLFFKLTGWQLAISFSMLAGLLVSVSHLRHGGILRFFAGACAAVATWIVFQDSMTYVAHAALTASVVTGILTLTTWKLRRRLSLPATTDWRALGFAVLAGLCAIPACGTVSFAGTDSGGITLLALSLLAMAILPRLGIVEARWVAQPLAVYGQMLLVARLAIHPALGFPTLVLAAFALAFIHLWQCERMPCRVPLQVLHSIIPIALAIAWVFTDVASAARPATLSLIALLLFAHAALTGVGVLASLSAVFTIMAVCTTGYAAAEQFAWLSPAISIGLLAVQPILFRYGGARVGLNPVAIRIASVTIRVVALALGVGMVFAYVPDTGWFLSLLAAGLALFAVACIRKSAEAASYAAVLSLVALTAWFYRLPIAPVSGWDVGGFAAMAVAQQFGRRRELPWFGRTVQDVTSGIAIFGAWFLLHRLLDTIAGGFLLTICWSLYAFVVLGLGFILRERTYRLLGLMILGTAIARVFLVDVWQFETIYRILSFLVLGAVLLIIGFLYNRLAETLRRWL